MRAHTLNMPALSCAVAMAALSSSSPSPCVAALIACIGCGCHLTKLGLLHSDSKPAYDPADFAFDTLQQWRLPCLAVLRVFAIDMPARMLGGTTRVGSAAAAERQARMLRQEVAPALAKLDCTFRLC